MKTNLKNVIATIVATVSICFIGGAVFAAKMSNEGENSKKYAQELVSNQVCESKSETNLQNTSVSYIILQVEDKNANELQYKEKKITDRQKIDSLMQIIDNAIPYKASSFIPDFGDIPTCATIYLSNGEHYTIATGDGITDNGKKVNLITKWSNEDGSEKALYQVNSALGAYIENLFNN